MRFALRRLGFFVLTLWAALTLNFFLPRLMPGNPALAMMAKFHGQVNGQALNALEVIFGVNTHQSLLSQYVHYLGQVATGNFGTSLYFYPESVGRGDPQRHPVDARPGRHDHHPGLRARHRPGHRRRLAARRPAGQHRATVFVITSAIPYFWVGMMFILIFGVSWSGCRTRSASTRA